MVTLINRINRHRELNRLVSAEDLYHQRITNLTDDDLQLVSNFYDTWEGQNEIQLQFRFVKIFAYREKLKDGIWLNLHQLLNIRRISNDKFPRYIREIISEGIYPLRIYQSCTEWLAPNEIFSSNTPRIIRSGFIPVENDDDLDISLATAKLVIQEVDEAMIIFSGNKSIHTWIPFEIDDLSSREAAFADRREQAEIKARTTYFEKLQAKIPYVLDRRISTDSRRVVPMPNTLNGMTNRRVIILSEKELKTITPDDILSMAMFA